MDLPIILEKKKYDKNLFQKCFELKKVLLECRKKFSKKLINNSKPQSMWDVTYNTALILITNINFKYGIIFP